MTNKTMSNESRIEQNVMRRVNTIHRLRPLVSGGALAALVMLLALYGIGREVWVGRVFQNMPHTGDVVAIGKFYTAAFMNTRLAVQALSVTTLSSVIYLARETARVLSTALSFARV